MPTAKGFMKRLTAIIRADGEFEKFAACLEASLAAEEVLPIAVNGLSGGAEYAFLTETVVEAVRLCGSPTLVLAESESDREKIAAALASEGLNVRQYKKRDLIFHNIRASHDVDRERLSLLSDIISKRCDAVVTTPSAAAVYTLSPGALSERMLDISCGELMPPEKLCYRLVSLGFVPVETVDGAGQFSRRGGIVDFWGGESLRPIRVEFFGDEIDRLA